MHIEFKYEKILDVVILKFYNEITIFQERDFKDLLSGYENQSVILDFSELDYIDSTGINVIIQCTKEKDVYVLTQSNNMLTPILKILNLDKALNVYETIEQLYKDIQAKNS